MQTELSKRSPDAVKERMAKQAESLVDAATLVAELTVDRHAIDLLDTLAEISTNRTARHAVRHLETLNFDQSIMGLVESCCPGLQPGRIRKIKKGARYNNTKEGENVLISGIFLNRANFQRQGPSVGLTVMVYHLNEKGQIVNNNEAYEVNAYDTEPIPKDEELKIVQYWATPDPEFAQLYDGDPVSHVPDLRVGASASALNKVTQRDSRMAVKCQLRLLDRWSEIGEVHLSIPVAGSGFMYSVYIPSLREHVEFERSQLKKRVYDKDMLDRVIMPMENKNTLLGAVMGDPADLEKWGINETFNKGTGTILLAYGPPGTGKTMTAEALAEFMERPLYIVDSSDLGDDATEFEEGVKNVFERARRWNAVVLFDEAEVYIGAREKGDIQANARVAAMLRHLEHFKGVLFLTTNRPVQLDYAIDSRIHAQIFYPNFNDVERGKVWKCSLPKKFPCKITAKDIKELSKFNINGREIKTAIVNAARTASYQKQQGILTGEKIPFEILLGSARTIANSSKALRESRTKDWSSYVENTETTD